VFELRLERKGNKPNYLLPKFFTPWKRKGLYLEGNIWDFGILDAKVTGEGALILGFPLKRKVSKEARGEVIGSQLKERPRFQGF